jgi:hypothetical protein
MASKGLSTQRHYVTNHEVSPQLRDFLRTLPPERGTQYADWNNPIRLQRTKSGKVFTAIQVTCKLCGWKRWLAITDALKALGIHNGQSESAPPHKLCKHCASQKGYRITRERYGREYADERRRLRQINNPPSSERIIAYWLGILGYEDQTTQTGTVFRLNDTTIDFTQEAHFLKGGEAVYERQVRFYADNRCHLIDFVIVNCVALQVMGFWHKFDARHQEYDQHFRRYWPGPFVEIDTDDIADNPDKVLADLNNLLNHTRAQ